MILSASVWGRWCLTFCAVLVLEECVCVCVYAPLGAYRPVPVLTSLSIANPSDIMSHYIALPGCICVGTWGD